MTAGYSATPLPRKLGVKEGARVAWLAALPARLPLGLVDVRVAAIDATWSGLKLVVRRELRG